jgi:hypothetical protein
MQVSQQQLDQCLDLASIPVFASLLQMQGSMM